MTQRGDARQGDEVYLRAIESLARNVVSEANREGWLSFEPDPDEASRLRRAVNELARTLRFAHFDGDGCLDH